MTNSALRAVKMVSARRAIAVVYFLLLARSPLSSYLKKVIVHKKYSSANFFLVKTNLIYSTKRRKYIQVPTS